MALDISREFIEALRSADGRAALADAIGPVVDEIVQRRLAERAEQLQPLAAILGCERKAANSRLARDADLRNLGVLSGKRLLFRASDVESYLRTRAGRR
jgi:hypothetical protein